MKTLQNLARRKFLSRSLKLISASALIGLQPDLVFGQTGRSLRIGIVGSGNIGGNVGLRWAAAGHQILFSSRNPDQLTNLVQEGGPLCRAGYPADAIAFGEVILIAVPYAALPQIGRDFGAAMSGKVVIDCGNPYVRRDGEMAAEALEKGTGIASAEYLPGVRLVRAFNAIYATSVRDFHHRQGELIAIPIAGDDEEAVAVTSDLVIDAGFDPVVVGGLETARLFDQGTEVYVKDLTAAQLRQQLNL